MNPLQVVAEPTVWLASLVVLVAYAIVGGAVALDARSNDVDQPARWGGAVFVAMFAGTILLDRQLLGAALFGLFVIVLYAGTVRT
ncbi:hypothetical protein [Natronosalvus vescus]|uniref:hypothetical protein n=1 Tax=Natronosalvus vescus TaxID=2953881 RepID=UPI002090F216|nr:hypothetical protein [Natronosalvus vescus]